MFDQLDKFISSLFYTVIWLFLTLVATLFVLGVSFTSLWTPWFFLTYVVSTAIFVLLRVTVLRLD